MRFNLKLTTRIGIALLFTAITILFSGYKQRALALTGDDTTCIRDLNLSIRDDEGVSLKWVNHKLISLDITLDNEGMPVAKKSVNSEDGRIDGMTVKLNTEQPKLLCAVLVSKALDTEYEYFKYTLLSSVKLSSEGFELRSFTSNEKERYVEGLSFSFLDGNYECEKPSSYNVDIFNTCDELLMVVDKSVSEAIVSAAKVNDTLSEKDIEISKLENDLYLGLGDSAKTKSVNEITGIISNEYRKYSGLASYSYQTLIDELKRQQEELGISLAKASGEGAQLEDKLAGEAHLISELNEKIDRLNDEIKSLVSLKDGARAEAQSSYVSMLEAEAGLAQCQEELSSVEELEAQVSGDLNKIKKRLKNQKIESATELYRSLQRLIRRFNRAVAE